MVKSLGDHFHTSHLLVVQWDGYVVNASAWTDEFLAYDYIGAPWGFHTDQHRVGNGGFSLRSRRLFDALKDETISKLDPEDHAICRWYRPYLEQHHAIRFADEELAKHFSFETTYIDQLPFGFHGLFNMWMFLSPQELAGFVSQLSPQTVAGRQFLALGRNYVDLGKFDQAKTVLTHRIGVCPDDAEAARLLKACQPQPQATPRNASCPCGSGQRYKHCCGSQPATPTATNVESLLTVAMATHQAGRLDDADVLYRRILGVVPDHAYSRHYLGVIAMQKGDPRSGESDIRAAITSRPDVPDFHNNLGLCLRLQNRYAEAIEAYEQALTLDPSYVPSRNNLGLDLLALNRIGEARAQFEQAISLRGDFAEAHWNLGLAHLVAGDLTHGWPEYEWRTRCQPFNSDGLSLDKILPWQGEDLTAKTLLVRREQGTGDNLQFLRFLPDLAKRGGKILLDIGPEIAQLMGPLPTQVEIAQDKASLHRADYYINLMSLPERLKVGLGDLPFAENYLSPPPEIAEKWESRLISYDRPRLGLVWAGNPRHPNDRNRSCPLHALAPLLELPELSWFSLQKGPACAQLEAAGTMKIVDLGKQFENFSDTAAAIRMLDLVITVDTSVAHLAAGMGKPTWILLPFAPDWRWMLERADSPWYPSVRLFRQPALGDWQSVVRNMENELRHQKW